MWFETDNDAPHWRWATLRLYAHTCHIHIVYVINFIIKQVSAAEVWKARNHFPADTSGGTLLHQPRSLRRLQELQDLCRLPRGPQPALCQGDADRCLGPAVAIIGLRRQWRGSGEGKRSGMRSRGEWRLGQRERPACSPEGVRSSAALPHTGRNVIVFIHLSDWGNDFTWVTDVLNSCYSWLGVNHCYTRTYRSTKLSLLQC